MKKVLIIIPAYNEGENILKTVNDLIAVNKNVDYIVINDGSKDNTREVCLNNKLNFIDLPVNLGIGGAVQTGYLYAYNNNYDIAIQYDGDGQHNPKYIDDLINDIDGGNDLSIGSRYISKLSKFRSTKMRQVGIKFLSWLIRIIAGKKIYDPTSGFRACNKRIIKLFAFNYPIDYPEPDSVTRIIKMGYNVGEIPVEMNARQNGSSSINFIDSIYYMIKVSICIISANYVKKEVKKWALDWRFF